MKSYELQIDGLADAVAAATPSPAHADLLQALRRLLGLQEAFLATSREGGWRWAGREVIKGAEADQRVLAEHDYRILRRWMDAPYGF